MAPLKAGSVYKAAYKDRGVTLKVIDPPRIAQSGRDRGKEMVRCSYAGLAYGGIYLATERLSAVEELEDTGGLSFPDKTRAGVPIRSEAEAEAKAEAKADAKAAAEADAAMERTLQDLAEQDREDDARAAAEHGKEEESSEAEASEKPSWSGADVKEFFKQKAEEPVPQEKAEEEKAEEPVSQEVLPGVAPEDDPEFWDGMGRAAWGDAVMGWIRKLGCNTMGNVLKHDVEKRRKELTLSWAPETIVVLAEYWAEYLELELEPAPAGELGVVDVSVVSELLLHGWAVNKYSAVRNPVYSGLFGEFRRVLFPQPGDKAEYRKSVLTRLGEVRASYGLKGSGCAARVEKDDVAREERREERVAQKVLRLEGRAPAPAAKQTKKTRKEPKEPTDARKSLQDFLGNIVGQRIACLKKYSREECLQIKLHAEALELTPDKLRALEKASPGALPATVTRHVVGMNEGKLKLRATISEKDADGKQDIDADVVHFAGTLYSLTDPVPKKKKEEPQIRILKPNYKRKCSALEEHCGDRADALSSLAVEVEKTDPELSDRIRRLADPFLEPLPLPKVGENGQQGIDAYYRVVTKRVEVQEADSFCSGPKKPKKRPRRAETQGD